jgi:glycosyltransferase involved in cell wall biosynthesis
MSTPSPLISVVLPAYNCAPYLAQAIESILAQTLADFELLIVYDKSPDATLQIIETYQARDPRIVLIHGEGKRLVGALNLGIDACTGSFIARMDADDISRPERFAHQVELMQKQNLDFCGCNMVMVNEGGKPIQSVVMPSTPDLVTITLACTVPFAHGSVMMRKAFLDQHALRYPANAAAEDYQFWCQAYHLGAHFGNVNEFLFDYRHFAQSLSKVHAKVVARHTSALRRTFVKDNIALVTAAIDRLLSKSSRLSDQESGFLLLAAYLVFLQTHSSIFFKALFKSKVKTIAIAIAKIARGF